MRGALVRSSLLLSLAACLPGLAAAAACDVPKAVVIDRDNAVTGLKQNRLYAYVDLASQADRLVCADEAALVAMVVKAAREAAIQWWAQAKFAKSGEGVIDVITILNKDEYARADFSSALRHGQVNLRRENGQVQVTGNNLTFANLRQRKPRS